MKCPNCGAENSNDSQYCANCGHPVETSYNDNYNNSYNNDYNHNNQTNYNGGRSYSNQNNKKPKGTNPLVIVIIVLVAIILFIVAFIAANSLMSGNNPFVKATSSPSPTLEPTPVVTETPAPTPEVIYITPEPQQAQQPPQQPPNQQPAQVPPAPQRENESVVRYPSYSTYSSSSFNFSCNYPSHFSSYNDGLNTSLYTVRSSDGNAIEKICAKTNEGETVQGQLQNFIDTHRGTVDYKTSGSDYFAASIVNGTMHYYKYCKFKNGNLYWFEFEYNTADYADVYDEYINDIYRSFSIN
jgi:hypothetical protein